MKRIGMVLVLGMLSACASSDRKQVADVAVMPLQDLNVVKVEVPEVLRRAEKGTFAAPVDASCAALLADIAALDTVLGLNGDADDEDDDSNLLKRGKDEVEKAAVKALKTTAEDVVPFRKWVRKLTGAERRSKDLADAVAAGYARRSFLKGYAMAKDCNEAEIAAQAN